MNLTEQERLEIDAAYDQQKRVSLQAPHPLDGGGVYWQQDRMREAAAAMRDFDRALDRAYCNQ